jgi:hypothetical protein
MSGYAVGDAQIRTFCTAGKSMETSNCSCELVTRSTLKSESTSLIDPKLAELRSDVLFSVVFAGRPAFVYVLMEHQSSSDRWMPLRLLGYMVRIWEAHLQEHPRSERLPAIIPLVVHHGAGGWTAARVFSDVIDLDDEARSLLAEYLPSFRYQLDELSAATNEELMARRMTAFGMATLICLSRAQTSDNLVSVLAGLLNLLDEVVKAPNGVAALGTILRYLLEVTKGAEQVHELARQLGQRGEEAYMTAAQILTEQARAEGEAKVLLKLLEQKFGKQPSAVVERVRSASIEELDRWVERVIKADSIEEVLV